MAKRFTIDDWQQRLNKLNQPLLIIEKRKEDKKEVFTLQCYKCGGTFDADRRALKTACLLREKGKYQINWCPICNRRNVVKGINDVATLRKDLIQYFDDFEDSQKYGIGNHERVRLRCPVCKQTKMSQVCDLCAKGFHCDYCNDNVSLGEKIIRNLILQLPIKEYDFEFTDSWTQSKRYDCFFKYDNKKYLIEVDGEQHIKNTSWSSKEWQNQNDSLKSKLAQDNGFHLIRIKAYKTDFDYIKQSVLESKLSELFDLSEIDWNVICKQTVTSRNVEIVEYYMSHKTMLIKDMAEHFHVSQPTLTRTLEKLTKIGMCDYSREKVFLNGRKTCVENRIKDNISFTVFSPSKENLGTFKTASECLYELKEELVGIGLEKRTLSTILYQGSSFKGYTFVYENGLYNYHKDKHPNLFVMCELYNNGLSIKEIAIKMNISTAKVYKNVIAGANMGICNYLGRNKIL